MNLNSLRNLIHYCNNGFGGHEWNVKIKVCRICKMPKLYFDDDAWKWPDAKLEQLLFSVQPELRAEYQMATLAEGMVPPG